MNKQLLAIAIPTYNRSNVLLQNLKAIMPKLIEYKIPVYISDDSDNIATQGVIEQLVIESSNQLVFYKKNTPSLGHDANCLATLSLPDTDYVWYLGDSIVPSCAAIDEVLDVLKACSTNKLDFVSVNCDSKANYPAGYVADLRDFLIKNTWFLTMTGSTIYSRDVIQFSKELDVLSCYKNFMQIAIVLEYCTKNPHASYFWIQKNSVFVNQNKKNSYWVNRAVSVFAVDWWNFVSHFTMLFSPAEVKIVALSHSVNTNIFGFFNWLRICSFGTFSKREFCTNKKEISLTSKLPLWVVRLIMCVPTGLLSSMFKFIDYVRSLRN